MTDPAWLDAQYDARGDRNLRVEPDLRYGAGPLQTADWFAPADPRAPVFVFVHGGYWRGSDKSVHSFVAPALVRAGATVVLPNYDLCPAVTIETITREIGEAIDWVAGRAPQASRIIVGGHSAGAHLAAWFLATSSDGVGPRVSGALGVSGLYDLEPIRNVPSLASDLRLDARSARQLSPVERRPPAGAVFHAFVGADESDEFRRQSILLAQRWGGQAVPVCETIEGRRHFDILDDLANPEGRLFASAMELLFGGK